MVHLLFNLIFYIFTVSTQSHIRSKALFHAVVGLGFPLVEYEVKV